MMEEYWTFRIVSDPREQTKVQSQLLFSQLHTISCVCVLRDTIVLALIL